jgi:hypothetical protein
MLPTPRSPTAPIDRSTTARTRPATSPSPTGPMPARAGNATDPVRGPVRVGNAAGTPGGTDRPSPSPSPPPGHGEPPASGAAELLALARGVDADLTDAGVDGAVVRISTVPSERLSAFALDGAHPLRLLLRFVAPSWWTALGVSSTGQAHPLDADGRPRSRPDSPKVRVTVLLGRDGASAGVLRHDDGVTPMPDPPEGVVADACRRALGLATMPPPAGSAELWTLAWLDRIVDAAVRRDGSPRLADWPAIAALHPAVGPSRQVPDPPALVAAAAALAEAWPWSRLRAEPNVVSIPGVDQSPATAAWMDDGMWARWLLAGLPARADLLAAVHDLLPGPAADAVSRVVVWC